MRKMLLAGGALQDDNEDVYGEIVRLAGGVEQARVGIITAASEPGEAEANGLFYQELLTSRYGAAHAEWIPIDLDRISNRDHPAVIEQIGSMTAFLFGGGDQSKLLRCFLQDEHTDSKALALIRSRFEKGTLIAGTSAGAVIQSAGPMVTGGAGAEDVTWEARGGFGFFPYGLLDSHFSERDRLGRMLHMAKETGWKRVYGIDEDTALVIMGREARVLGRNQVVVADASEGSVKGYSSGNQVEL